MSAQDNLSPVQFFHGTKAELSPGDVVEPGHPPNYKSVRPQGREAYSSREYVYATTDPQVAFDHWFNTPPKRMSSEKPVGGVYKVEPVGDVERDPEDVKNKGLFMSRSGFRVKGTHTGPW